MIDFTARERHYMDHLSPIWRALPPELRGRFFVPQRIEALTRSRGVEPTVYSGDLPPFGDGGPIVVAAVQDNRRAMQAAPDRPVVFCSHGIGQAFNAADGSMDASYSGGPGRENVALFLAVNEYQADRWRRGYPTTPVEIIGCPKLDGREPERGPRPDGPIALTFHWPGTRYPECGTAFGTFKAAIGDLRRAFGERLVAHVHPRAMRRMRGAFEAAGIPFLEDFEDVITEASVLLNDASSVLYEFAAVGGPVVVLNSPTFRRDVHHGLRFWEYADVGIQVDRPGDLVDAVWRALEDPPEIAERRREIAAAVLPHIGEASRRAVDAILSMEVARERIGVG